MPPPPYTGDCCWYIAHWYIALQSCSEPSELVALGGPRNGPPGKPANVGDTVDSDPPGCGPGPPPTPGATPMPTAYAADGEGPPAYAADGDGPPPMPIAAPIAAYAADGEGPPGPPYADGDGPPCAPGNGGGYIDRAAAASAVGDALFAGEYIGGRNMAEGVPAPNPCR